MAVSRKLWDSSLIRMKSTWPKNALPHCLIIDKFPFRGITRVSTQVPLRVVMYATAFANLNFRRNMRRLLGACSGRRSIFLGATTTFPGAHPGKDSELRNLRAGEGAHFTALTPVQANLLKTGAKARAREIAPVKFPENLPGSDAPPAARPSLGNYAFPGRPPR